MEKDKEYFLGLDIGTNSVGYAVTDTHYNVLRVKDKHFWGVRLFEEIKDNKENLKRRTARSARRRLARKKMRLEWLREIFKPELDKIDSQLFIRLKYSNLWYEDKQKNNISTKDSIFNTKIDGKLYTDQDYHREYKTIFHLRKELTEKPAKDIRFLYLALHSIIKSRGHFLDEGCGEQGGKLEDIINKYKDFINLINDDDKDFNWKITDQKKKTATDEEKIKINIGKEFDIVKLRNLLNTNSEEYYKTELEEGKNKKIRLKKSEIKIKFYEFFGVGSSNKIIKNMIDAIIYGEINLSSIFNNEGLDGIKSSDDKNIGKKLNLGIIENVEEIKSYLTDNQSELLDKLVSLYSLITINKIIGENSYICQAKVETYEKHKKQLIDFKNFIKTYYIDEVYKEIFEDISNKNANYVAYIQNGLGNRKNDKKRVYIKPCNSESFYSYIVNSKTKGKIDNGTKRDNIDNEEYEIQKSYIKELIELNDFLPKLKVTDNSVLPNSLYLNELRKIIEVNKNKFNFLNEKDETGLTNAEKIEKILTYRVPYFVGPITERENSEFKNNVWVKLKDKNVDLRPWNIEEKVDFGQTEEEFILRMTNKCSYLPKEDVLPNCSLIYQKFKVLNELNSIKIDGNLIKQEQKICIYNGLLKKYKKVTIKRLRDYIKSENLDIDIDKKEISGISKDGFNNSLQTHIYLVNNGFTDQEIDEKQKEIEEIIKWKTIITDSNRLEKRIRDKFANKFTEQQLKALKGLTSSKWGRLSKRLLVDILSKNYISGEMYSVLDVMENNVMTLEEVLNSSNYEFKDKYLKEQKGQIDIDNITYEYVDDLYCSGAVKRASWQTILLIKEIKTIMGKMPNKIFVEVTRENQESKDPESKKSALQNTYNKQMETIKGIAEDYKELNDKLAGEEVKKFNSEKVYLYYTQLGKCPYCGGGIEYNKVLTGENCDIDHIIPQSKIKDDSPINNKVLVHRECNDIKGDIYPLSEVSRLKINKAYLKKLKDIKLISDEKYDRLVREKKLTLDEMNSFINRQLVETNQTSKIVIDMLRNVVDNPRQVVYSKARVVSDFRNKFGITKCRRINDLHHAKDAYLNIVIGNILFNRFENIAKYKAQKESKENKEKTLTKNIIKLFNKKIYDKNGNIIWNPTGTDNNLDKVKKICSRDDILVSVKGKYKENGQFYDETIYSPKEKANSNLIQLKSKSYMSNESCVNDVLDVNKYGGYNSMKNGYFMLLEVKEYDKKGKLKKIKKILEAVPFYYLQTYKNDENKQQKILEVICKQNGYDINNVRILKDVIPYRTQILMHTGDKVLKNGKTKEVYGRFGIQCKYDNSSVTLSNENQWIIKGEHYDYIKLLDKTTKMKNLKKSEDGESLEVYKRWILKDKNKIQEPVCVTKKQNLELYDILIKQAKKNFYPSQIKNLAETLKGCREEFKNLDIIDDNSGKGQIFTLLSIIDRLNTGTKIVDLTSFKKGVKTGKLIINKNITDKKIKIIHQSITGLIERLETISDGKGE